MNGSALSGGHGLQEASPALRRHVGGGVQYANVNAGPHAVSTNCAASLAAFESRDMLVFALFPIVNGNGFEFEFLGLNSGEFICD
jgi:hypothetical protein